MTLRARRWRVGALVMPIAAVLVGFAVRPPGPQALSSVATQPRLWHGAYHVHSTQSDGSGSPDAIAAAAAAAGLDFVILTDHGDATRMPAAPRYVDGVLIVDAVEISTDDGHYVALGLPQAPYPLAGEGRAVVEDVRRLGGIGILAHPDSPRRSLAWHDLSVDADGFEWVNADSTWRGATAGHLLARLFTYPLNRGAALASLADYPAALFAERDSPARPPQLALAAVDAHARIGWRREADPLEGGRTLARFPSYRASFGTFGVIVPWRDGGPTGEAVHDANVVLHAIRARLAYTSVFSMAMPAWLSLDLQAAAGASEVDARGEATLLARSNAPEGAVLKVRRNGQPWKDAPGPELSVALPPLESPALYRAELWLRPRRGWPALPLAVSAVRGHNLSSVRPSATGMEPDAGATTMAGPSMGVQGWHVEHDARSTGHVATPPDALAAATLALAPGSRVSQFAALVADLGERPADADGLVLALSADGPMRLSVQLREPRPGEGLRWRHSAYLDATTRVVRLPIADFRPIRPASGAVPLDRIHALLLVMDTVNARPGDRRTVTVHAARWTSAR